MPTILNAAGEDMTQQISRKVGMNLFFWALGALFAIMMAGFGWTFTAVSEAGRKVERAEARVEGFTTAMSGQAVEIREIKVNVEWIKRALETKAAVDANDQRRPVR